MSVVQTIADRSRERHPTLLKRVEGDTITVERLDEDGFPVWLREEDGSYVVGFDGWHEHFDSEEGRCQFGGLPPGNYSIRYVGGPGDRLAVPVIEVGPLARGERREIEAGAVEGSVLCGTVRRAETGAPIEHAWVRYEGASYPRTGSSSISASVQSARTDAEGRFASRTALVPGPLFIWVSAESGGKRVRLQHEAVVGREPRTELDLTVPFESSDTPGV
jgi:hypothetical protein